MIFRTDYISRKKPNSENLQNIIQTKHNPIRVILTYALLQNNWSTVKKNMNWRIFTEFGPIVKKKHFYSVAAKLMISSHNIKMKQKISKKPNILPLINSLKNPSLSSSWYTTKVEIFMLDTNEVISKPLDWASQCRTQIRGSQIGKMLRN